MFTKKFLESNFTPLNFITSRQRKKPPAAGNGADARTNKGQARDIRQEPPLAEADTDADASLLSRHKGKLAVGAAAMLGIAAFYHWRESKLAKEDEEEYARLQRLKAALDAFESKHDR